MNTAANPLPINPLVTKPPVTNAGPLYRRFELPWSQVEEESQRLRRIALIVMGTLLLLSLIIPMLPVQKIDRNNAPDIPPRLARILIEKQQPQPVVPKKPEPVTARVEPKPVPMAPPKPVQEVQPEPVPPPVEKPIVVDTPPPVSVQPTAQQERVRAREKAKTTGLLAVADDLASLRDNTAAASTSGRRLSAATDNNARTERALITSKQGKRSAGVNTAALSRDTGGGGGLVGRSTTAVTSPVTTAASATQATVAAATGTSTSGDYAGQRSQDEIETIFDKNKAAIYALYRRALRQDPTLQGKLVLELTIAPSGKVTDCKVVSSELGAPQFESSLIRRVKLFDFGAQDVQEITTTKPIDFFPA